jgi:hypothetical protein
MGLSLGALLLADPGGAQQLHGRQGNYRAEILVPVSAPRAWAVLSRYEAMAGVMPDIRADASVRLTKLAEVAGASPVGRRLLEVKASGRFAFRNSPLAVRLFIISSSTASERSGPGRRTEGFSKPEQLWEPNPPSTCRFAPET